VLFDIQIMSIFFLVSLNISDGNVLMNHLVVLLLLPKRFETAYQLKLSENKTNSSLYFVFY
jgi:hypothetical protein